MFEMLRKTRGKPSKVDRLPSEIKGELDEMLRDGRLTQREILEIVNETIAEAGLSDEQQLSIAGVCRYATKMESVGARIRQAREVSQQWINKLGAEPKGEVSQILIEVVRTLAFDAALDASSGAPAEPKLIKDLAIAVSRLENAAAESHRREASIRREVAAAAASKAEKIAAEAGLKASTVAQIKSEILGI